MFWNEAERLLNPRAEGVASTRATWLNWLVAGLAALLIFGGLYYRDYLSPQAQARQVATAFWRAVTAGRESEVAGFLAPDSPQTAGELAAFFRGYTQEGFYHSLQVQDVAEAFRPYGLEYDVISGVVTPDGYTSTFVVGLKRAESGELRVFFVGKGYSGGPEGRIVPHLTP